MSAKDELRELVEELTEHEAAQALRRLKTLRPRPTGRPADAEERKRRIREIARHSAALPILDPRPADEIVGYDDRGRPA